MKGRMWGRERDASLPILLEQWTAPPLHTPMYYILLLLVALRLMLFLFCEGCLALPLTNHWALEGPLWSLRTWPPMTPVRQGCRYMWLPPLIPTHPRSSPRSPLEFSSDALSAQAFRQEILVKSTAAKGMWPSGLTAFEWYSLFQQNLNLVKNTSYNLFWHFQAGHVCRTSRVIEAMCFKTNTGSRFQNHKVVLSVHISSVVCQAAALQNNHVSTLIYYPPYNNA